MRHVIRVTVEVNNAAGIAEIHVEGAPDCCTLLDAQAIAEELACVLNEQLDVEEREAVFQ